MEGQTMLTNYFTAVKSRQNTHPAKRQKVAAEIDVLSSKYARLDDRTCASLTQETVDSNVVHVSDIRKKSRTKLASRSRTRTCKTKGKAPQTKVVSEGVVSMSTSVKDDHQAGRSRKLSQVNNCFELPSTKVKKHITSPDSSRTEHKPNQKDVKTNNTGLEAAKASDVNPKIVPLSQTLVETNGVSSSAPKSVNIASRCKRSLKVDPWIAEQSKLVLASRGKQALQKSIGKKKEIGSMGKMVKENDEVVAKPIPRVEKTSKVDAKPEVDVPRLSEGFASLPDSQSKLPAYKRFSHLLEAKKPKSSDVTQNLPLPYNFKVLEEMFRCVDVVLSLKQKRYETCTFDKLKDSVQEMCRKKFEKKHLAQMQTVFPGAFAFRQQSVPCGFAKMSEYELTIDFKTSANQEQKPKDFKFIQSSDLIARQKQFKNELLKITMKYHQQYLAKKHPLLTVKNEAIMRWHPCFSLDEVPEIEQSPLPEPPKVKTYSTAQDVLDQACLHMTPRIEKALINVAKKSHEMNSGKMTAENPKNADQTSKNNSCLKGISQSLIDKIRRKEEKKVQESLTADSEVLERRVMGQRLPELCRILKTYFLSERKAAIPLEDVRNKLAESYTSTLSAVQVEKHVQLLSEMAPEWLSIMYVRQCPYVKLKKNVNVNHLMEKLKSIN